MNRILAILLLSAVGCILPLERVAVYPRHWGKPPLIQTTDVHPLPYGYGHGSSTLVGWIHFQHDYSKKHFRIFHGRRNAIWVFRSDNDSVIDLARRGRFPSNGVSFVGAYRGRTLQGINTKVLIEFIHHE